MAKGSKNTVKKIKTTNIKKILDTIDENKRCLAERLIEKVEFMEKTLEELSKMIEKDGAVITTINGNGFEVISEHPAQRSYVATMGRYNAIIKTIADMIPNGSSEGDELIEFLTGVKK